MRGAILAGFLLAAAPAAAQPIAPVMECEALAGMDLAAATGVAGAVTEARRDGAACRVQATLRGTITVAITLPLQAWTGRFLQIGCGGLCGRIPDAAPQTAGCLPLERGEFVTAATDMGHRDPSAASWGADPERREDFAHRAQHLTARAAKAVIARFYGRAQSRAYFSGCSDGGREGLMAARLHPEDFDGIIAGAPVLDFTVQNTLHHSWTVQRQAAGALTAGRLPLLARLVAAQCGDPDGVVRDPLACRFDPRAHVGADPATSLSAAEAATAAAIYDGARTASGERLTAGGLLPGSERNWAGTVAAQDAATPPRARLFAGGVLRHLAFPPGTADAPTPDALPMEAATLARIAASQRVFDATSTDLAPFFARGGRLLLWHGLADQDISPHSTIAWWAALRRDQPGAADAARLFLIPGLAHCRGGVGTTSFDSLSPLLRWVEEGVAPDMLAGTAPTGDLPPQTFLAADRFGPRR